mgnify:CR=1 FL=1
MYASILLILLRLVNHGQSTVDYGVIAQGCGLQLNGGTDGGHAVLVNFLQNLLQEHQLYVHPDNQ